MRGSKLNTGQWGQCRTGDSPSGEWRRWGSRERQKQSQRKHWMFRNPRFVHCSLLFFFFFLGSSNHRLQDSTSSEKFGKADFPHDLLDICLPMMSSQKGVEVFVNRWPKMAEHALLLSTSAPSLTHSCSSRGWCIGDWVSSFDPVGGEIYFPLKHWL